MRNNVIFLILWSLLVLSRAVDLLHDYGEYRLGGSLESVIVAREPVSNEDAEVLAKLSERREELRDSSLTTGGELLLLAGVCWVFFRTHNEAISATGEEKRKRVSH